MKAMAETILPVQVQVDFPRRGEDVCWHKEGGEEVELVEGGQNVGRIRPGGREQHQALLPNPIPLPRFCAC